MNWEYLRSDEFKDAVERSGGLCVMPLGCLEKHGPHLPVGTDSLKAIKLIEEAAEIEEVCVFPIGMWMGDVMGAKNIKDPLDKNSAGFIGISPTTLLTVLEELCNEIARNGFRKILILNSHGGNNPLLSYFVRAMSYKNIDYALMWTQVRSASIYTPTNMYRIVQERIDEFPYLTKEDLEAMSRMAKTGANAEAMHYGGHADWTETALMYGYYPELVCEERFEAESGISTHRSDYLMDNGIECSFAWPCNYPNSFQGYSSRGCSENIGKAMRKLCVERLVKIFKLLKEDEDCVRMARKLPRL